MHNSSDAGRMVTILGASLFLAATAALSLSLYGETLSKTKSVALMICATLSAFVLSIGQYLLSSEARESKLRGNPSELPLFRLAGEEKEKLEK